MLVLLILFVIFAAFFIILLLPLTININYKRVGQNDSFSLSVFLLFKFLGLKIRVPYLRNRFFSFLTEIFAELESILLNMFSVKGEVKIEKTVDWTELKTVRIQWVLTKLLDRKLMSIIFGTMKVKCDHFYWTTEYGFSNPALTGVFNGFLWSIKGLLLNLLSVSMNFNIKPKIEIHTDFYNTKFNTEFKGIFSLRTGNIILTALKVYLYKFKGGNKLWENIQLRH